MNTTADYVEFIKEYAEVIVGFLNESDVILGVGAKVNINIKKVGGKMRDIMGHDDFIGWLVKGLSVHILNSKNLSPKKKIQIYDFNLACAYDYESQTNENGETEILVEYVANADVKIIKKICKKNGNSFKMTCDSCRELKHELFKCGACKSKRYCGAECAKKAWKAGHKHECAGLKAKAQV